MATTELNLTADGVWQEIGAIAFVLGKDRKINVQITNQNTLPVGDVACLVNNRDDMLAFPAPSDGSWYIRSVGLPTNVTITDVD